MRLPVYVLTEAADIGKTQGLLFTSHCGLIASGTFAPATRASARFARAITRPSLIQVGLSMKSFIPRTSTKIPEDSIRFQHFREIQGALEVLSTDNDHSSTNGAPRGTALGSNRKSVPLPAMPAPQWHGSETKPTYCIDGMRVLMDKFLPACRVMSCQTSFWSKPSTSGLQNQMCANTSQHHLRNHAPTGSARPLRLKCVVRARGSRHCHSRTRSKIGTSATSAAHGCLIFPSWFEFTNGG